MTVFLFPFESTRVFESESFHFVNTSNSESFILSFLNGKYLWHVNKQAFHPDGSSLQVFCGPF